MPTPKPVVWSFADGKQAWMERGAEAFEVLHTIMRPGVIAALFNAPFDLANAAARDPELMLEIFAKYERGEIFDCQVAMMLDAVAEGRLLEGTLIDRDGHQLTNNLSGCTYIYTGRSDAKANDQYKLLYGDLDALPIAQWPPEAQQYPLDDAQNTRDDAEIMMRVCQNLGPIGVPGRKDLPLITHTHLSHNERAHLIMHLGSIFGLRTDPKRLEELKAEIAIIRRDGDKKFRDLKFIKTEPVVFTRTGERKDEDGKDDTHEVKRRVILAYGGSLDQPCTTCSKYALFHGVGRGPFGKQKPPSINAKTGAVKLHEPSVVYCKDCNGTGLFVPSLVPRTPSHGICADRDVLTESSDADLEAWAEFGKHDKMEQTYGPALEKGISQPINIEANPLLATARTSYKGIIQLIPALARECVIPLEGGSLCSIDLAAGELCTFAQVCYTLFGASRMRDVINASKDPGALHSVLGAKMMGIDPNDAAALAKFILTTKDKASREAALRQLAKVGNFGFPGLMGPAKLVLSARKKGDYLCRISGMNQTCKKGVTEWNGKPLDRPTCPDCLEVAVQLRLDWLATWPETPEYFDWVKAIPGVRDGHGVMVSPLTGYVRGGLNASAAANHPFQHLLAYAKKQALWEVGVEAYTNKSSPLYGTRVIGDIHDELFTWIPKTPHQHEAAFRKKEIIISACRKFIPDVEVVADDPALMDRWLKKAAAIYMDNGKPTLKRTPTARLVEWTPELAALAKAT